ncbi:MAG: hypothetical protein OXI49_03300 [Acidobacteriota bacterium]|nr:hypothetical protein [Acidobacteriota bacterium]
MDKLTAALLSTMKKEVLDQAIDEAIAALERLRTADLASLLGEQLELPVGRTPRRATKKRSVRGSREAQVLEIVRPFLMARSAPAPVSAVHRAVLEAGLEVTRTTVSSAMSRSDEILYHAGVGWALIDSNTHEPTTGVTGQQAESERR